MTPRAVSTRISSRCEPLVAHETGEAARAVAALFDLAAVGVPDAVAEVVAGFARWLDEEELVAAMPKWRVGKAAHQGRREYHWLAARRR